MPSKIKHRSRIALTSAISVTPYVAIPLAIFEARKTGSINAQQMNILVCAYLWASRPEFRVAAYSAQRVCAFQGLEINRANLERYRRAAADLHDRYLIKRDYRKIDPRRNDQRERTYSIWVPAPGRFVAVGTREENQTRLWGAALSINTHCESGQTGSATPITDTSCSQSEVYTSDETRNASLSRNAMRIPNQENQKIETLPSSQGEASPLPSPPGMRSDGAGLLENPKPLPSVAADKEKRLHDAALQFIVLSEWLWGFIPARQDVMKLLRDFSPLELLYAIVEKFPPGDRFSTKVMAHFFARGARELIDAGRLDGRSENEPQWLRALNKKGSFEQSESREFTRRWGRVLDAYSGRDEMEDFEPDPRWAELLDGTETDDLGDEPIPLPLFDREQ